MQQQEFPMPWLHVSSYHHLLRPQCQQPCKDRLSDLYILNRLNSYFQRYFIYSSSNGSPTTKMFAFILPSPRFDAAIAIFSNNVEPDDRSMMKLYRPYFYHQAPHYLKRWQLQHQILVKVE